MGKYMRKCRAEDVAVGGVEVTQAVGVRTRSRAAAANVVVSKRRRPLPPASPSASSALARAQGGSCYLKLRSRMLFMAPPAPASASAAAAGHGAPPPLPAGLSRCSSTASSVDASAAAQDRSLPSCGSDAAANKAGAPEGSASNNAESGGNRERRETTPSSHFPGDLSDLESDLAGKNSGRSSLPQTLAAQAQPAARSRVPPAAEIEEFFAAAEEAEARRFACKYNFDVARGVPLDSGRYEWTPAVSSS
ncbi:cyclin-dependent kinase inhibitor 1 [Aegilops tauschii subsp. strangulata]|nr:cyclin-dependent kinase inhibitor 1 [Aegilops tauschii subsp. strangulata]